MGTRKLTWKQVRDIRARYNPRNPGHAAKLGAEHGVSRDTVMRVIRGSEAWPLEHDGAPTAPAADDRYIVFLTRGYQIVTDSQSKGGGGKRIPPAEAVVLDRCYSHRIMATFRSGDGGAQTGEQAAEKAYALAHSLNVDERRWEMDS